MTFVQDRASGTQLQSTNGGNPVANQADRAATTAHALPTVAEPMSTPWPTSGPRFGCQSVKSAPERIATARMTATTTSTAAQNGGHQRVLATK